MFSLYRYRFFSSGLMVMITLLMLMGCQKFAAMQPPPPTVSATVVYQSDATAIAVLTSLYTNMVYNGQFTGAGSISLLSGLSADEFTLTSVVSDNKLIAYYRNQLRSGADANYGTDLWSGGTGNGLFYYLFICNAAIEGLNSSTSLTPSVKKQLLGEAKFMRAFFYFYLVNFFGDVPLMLITTASVNAVVSRSKQEDVYQQIIADLKEAQDLLSDDYLAGDLTSVTSERLRPTKWAATALLARTYLYRKEYANAEAEAGKLISNTGRFSLLTDINSVFLKNSQEAILQLQPVQTGKNTEDGATFILPVTGPNTDTHPVYLSLQLLSVFENNDRRRKGGNWVDSVIVSGKTYFYPFKYKANMGAVSEYLMLFRLGEQYLIRAEARAHQGNVGEAQNDLNAIRNRAGLPNTTASDTSSLYVAILRERQVELFSELGQRWLDLKRTGKVDEVMQVVTPLKANGANWQSYQQWYPVPYSDIQKNTNLRQNDGYTTQ